MQVGIESLNFYGGTAFLDVSELIAHRKLDKVRFEHLLMKEKTVALPHEDPVSFAVNAAQPIISSLSEVQRSSIELLITCSESGIDFGKSISTYVHRYLGLSKNCRLFEVKQACYSGTAGLQMAANFILANTSPGAKALVIATDVSRYSHVELSETLSLDWSYAEPSGGAGAIAMLVSDQPEIFQLDIGASGCHGFEVMDTCRPVPDQEAGNADLSLLTYLDCCENTFREYQHRVPGTNYRDSFSYLTFHTPFGGMVKGAHRMMMRKLLRAQPQEIEDDYRRRVAPGMEYCQRVGNIMGGTVFLSLLSAIENSFEGKPFRVGCFAYGSGCCSEFFSGTSGPEGRAALQHFSIERHLSERVRLSLDEYEAVLKNNRSVAFGTRNLELNEAFINRTRESSQGRRRLALNSIKEFHREYVWLD